MAARQRPENQLSGVAFSASQEDNIPSCLWAESHPWLRSPDWEVILQWHWPLGPRAQGGLPHSQGMSSQPPHGCFVTFALQERALEPRLICTVLSSCGQNTLGAHLEPGPGPQTGFFFARGALMQGGPATACKGLPWLFASFCQS